MVIFFLIVLYSSKTLLAVNQVRPQDTFGPEHLQPWISPALELETSPALRHVKTSPALWQVRTSPALKQVWL